MLSGKRFRLTRPTTGMQHMNGAATLVTIPAAARIRVLSGPNGSERDKGLVYVLWEGREVALFAVDVEARGIEIKASDGGYESYQSATD